MKKNKKENVVEEKKSECTKCHSKLIYLRIKSQERVCRSCGHIEKLNNSDGKN